MGAARRIKRESTFGTRETARAESLSASAHRPHRRVLAVLRPVRLSSTPIIRIPWGSVLLCRFIFSKWRELPALALVEPPEKYNTDEVAYMPNDVPMPDDEKLSTTMPGVVEKIIRPSIPTNRRRLR